MDVGFLSCGDIRVSTLDTDGNAVSYSAITNFSSLKLTLPDPDTKQRISHEIDTNGQALDETSVAKPTTMAATFDTINAETLGWAFRALPVDSSVTGASVTNEVVTATLGRWAKLVHGRITSVVVKDSTGVTTYTVNTDYLVDANAGFVLPVVGGTITDATTIKANYTYATIASDTLGIGSLAVRYFRIEGRFKNLANGKEGWLTIPKVNASPSGDFDFLGGDFLAPSIKGTCISLNGQAPATFKLER